MFTWAYSIMTKWFFSWHFFSRNDVYCWSIYPYSLLSICRIQVEFKEAIMLCVRVYSFSTVQGLLNVLASTAMQICWIVFHSRLPILKIKTQLSKTDEHKIDAIHIVPLPIIGIENSVSGLLFILGININFKIRSNLTQVFFLDQFHL